MLRLFVVGLMLAVVPSAASAQADTVRGTVYDSLAQGPLAGASVLGNGEASTTTDSLGRFQLIGSARITRITVFHDALERIMLGALIAVREDTGRRWQPALSAPSMATVWTRLCTGRRPADGLGGILIGSVRATDESTRFAGATVELQWEVVNTRASARDTMPRYETRLVRSDAEGDFVFCGIQEFGPAGIAARASDFGTASVFVHADVRPLRRMDLMLGRRGQRTTIQGTVLDETGAPVSDASITLDGADSAAVSTPGGRFVLVNAPTGSRMLLARRVGFLPWMQPVAVPERGIRNLPLVIERGVTIEGVTITARTRISRERRELDERQRSGVGRFLDSTAIGRFPLLTGALRQFPALTIEMPANRSAEDGGFSFVVLGRRGGISMTRCRAQIFLDGVLADEDYIQLIPPADLAAIELFEASAFAPTRFQTLREPCAVLLLWTKSYLKR